MQPKFGIPVAHIVIAGLGAGAFALGRNTSSNNDAGGGAQQVDALDNAQLEEAQLAAAFVGATADGNPVAIVESTEGEVAAMVGDDGRSSEWIAGERDGDALRFEGNDVQLEAWEEDDGLQATLTVDGVEESLWLEPAGTEPAGAESGGERSSDSYE